MKVSLSDGDWDVVDGDVLSNNGEYEDDVSVMTEAMPVEDDLVELEMLRQADFMMQQTFDPQKIPVEETCCEPFQIPSTNAFRWSKLFVGGFCVTAFLIGVTTVHMKDRDAFKGDMGFLHKESLSDAHLFETDIKDIELRIQAAQESAHELLVLKKPENVHHLKISLESLLELRTIDEMKAGIRHLLLEEKSSCSATTEPEEVNSCPVIIVDNSANSEISKSLVDCIPVEATWVRVMISCRIGKQKSWKEGVVKVWTETEHHSKYSVKLPLYFRSKGQVHFSEWLPISKRELTVSYNGVKLIGASVCKVQVNAHRNSNEFHRN